MFEIKRRDDGILHFSGRLDATQVKVAETLLGSIEDSVTADLSQLVYISSAGIGALLETQKRLFDRGRRLTLVNLHPGVRDVFRFAGLEGVFSIG